jgi:hypothetical protein
MNSTIFLVLAALLVAMATSADAVTCNEACATQYPAGGVFSLSKKQTALCTETCMFAIKAISADKQDPTSPFKGESAADAAAKADASKGSLWAKHDWGGDVAKAAGKVSVAAINEVCKSGASVSKSSMQACQTGAILGSVAAASSTMQSSTKNQLMRAGVQGCTSWCNVNSGADYDGDDNTLVTKDLNTWSSFGTSSFLFQKRFFLRSFSLHFCHSVVVLIVVFASFHSIPLSHSITAVGRTSVRLMIVWCVSVDIPIVWSNSYLESNCPFNPLKALP